MSQERLSHHDSRRPFLLGLTGSIGMGKSVVTRMFQEIGVPVFDADAAVHALQSPISPLLSTIAETFPGTVGPEGVDRLKLGPLVFGNGIALARLEGIIHPAVRNMCAAFVREHAHHRLIVFDIPLLYETGTEREVDAVLVVSAPSAIQRKRVLSRPGMTEEKFDLVLRHQLSDAEKRRRADHVIDTLQPPDEIRQTVRELARKFASSRDQLLFSAAPNPSQLA